MANREKILYVLTTAIIGIVLFYVGRLSAPKQTKFVYVEIPTVVQAEENSTLVNQPAVTPVAIIDEPPLIGLTDALMPVPSASAYKAPPVKFVPSISVTPIASAVQPKIEPKLEPEPIILEEIPDNPYKTVKHD